MSTKPKIGDRIIGLKGGSYGKHEGVKGTIISLKQFIENGKLETGYAVNWDKSVDGHEFNFDRLFNQELNINIKDGCGEWCFSKHFKVIKDKKPAKKITKTNKTK